MSADVDGKNWVLDFCAGCDRLVWMDLMEQLCPECLGQATAPAPMELGRAPDA